MSPPHDPDEAYALWCKLGGNPRSEPERLGWERGRVRSARVRAGANRVNTPFETTRRHRQSRSRLRLLPIAIRLQEGG